VVTVILPVAAFCGTVAVTDVALVQVTFASGTETPLNFTVPLEVPKFVPLMVTEV
jgi:hypothetical protein